MLVQQVRELAHARVGAGQGAAAEQHLPGRDREHPATTLEGPIADAREAPERELDGRVFGRVQGDGTRGGATGACELDEISRLWGIERFGALFCGHSPVS